MKDLARVLWKKTLDTIFNFDISGPFQEEYSDIIALALFLTKIDVELIRSINNVEICNML